MHKNVEKIGRFVFWLLDTISGLLIGKNLDTKKVKYPLSMSNGGKISSIHVHPDIHVQGR